MTTIAPPRTRYSAHQVCRLSGASYRQVDYWARTGSLRPETEARGSGTARRYTLEEVIAARVLVVLSALGATGHVLAATTEAVTSGWAPALALVTIDGALIPIAGVDHLGDGWVVDMAAARAHVEAALAQLADEAAA